MKKNIYFLLFLTLVFNNLYSQISTEVVPISETFSSNGEFKLLSISYDEEFPNLRGESLVSYTQKYDSIGVRKKYYKIKRSFDIYEGNPFFAALSNDGRKIIYITNYVYENGLENKNVTYYVDGKLEKTYTTEEFINCDKNKEKCELFYNNRHQLFEGHSSTIKQYKKTASEKDIFLNKSFVFNKNDTIYVIDSRKKVTLYDLNKGNVVVSKIEFDSIYPKIRNIEPLKSRVSYYKYPYKYVVDIQNSQNNEKLSESIGKRAGLKFISINDSTFHKYKLFRIELSGYMNRNGKFEIENLQTDSIFDRKWIENYIHSTTFKTDFIPREVDRIYLKNFFGGYRSYDDKIAEKETLNEKERRKEEFKKRLTLEKIDGVYIPKNLYECLTGLDQILDFESKKQLTEAKDSWQFNSHMGGLGMWIRNNWGINGGSRLLKYFNDRNIGKEMFGNDDISGIIITQYINWLKGDKNAWKKWEKKNPKK
ncbi:hypothetical protein QGN23_00750 [Chryseobacterium gotjawalense]|uniref:DUF6794 domain-containing protein n=1 Tax=Chryseobacterium gotjawalense TaxID=3042315 RepID=A0ABY8REZ8_9FLAO|nr:DUF6794 domain-containing protein [Chryseobacterium sp. wdc7]WHF51822.1 hypothetical protein QGN23_00750 [Chryseobacterium sp. wdc7]